MFGASGKRWVLPEELRHFALSGDTQTVGELIALFKEDVAARLHLLREAVMTGDLATGAAQAHSIKGSAEQMGALPLAATCRHMELDAANHVTVNLERLLLEAEAEFQILQTTMEG